MKKIILTAFLICSVWVAKAQYIGIKGGYNFATLVGDDAQGVQTKNGHGFYAGITLDVPFSKLFSVLSEAQFNRLESRIVSQTIGKSTLTLDYLSVPVMAKILIYKGLSFHTGPQLNFLINNYDFEFAGETTSISVEDRAINTFDLSLVAGITYKTYSGAFFELRFSKGLANVFDASNTSLKTTGFGTDYDHKNLVISAGIGYIF